MEQQLHLNHDHHTADAMPEGRRVPQYGPEWVEHVMNGGEVRNGNILIES